MTEQIVSTGSSHHPATSDNGTADHAGTVSIILFLWWEHSLLWVSILESRDNLIFFRFAEWIEEQKLPKVVKKYCKNVLNFLGYQEKAEKVRATDQEETLGEYESESDLL